MLKTTLAITTTAVAASVPPGEQVLRKDWEVRGETGYLGVREVRLERPAHRRPVLLLHGARVPGIPSFDLPVAGGSLAADLARAGHRVFIVDARGYGKSDRPAALDAPASEHPPAVTGEQVVSDIASVVEWLQSATRNAGVDIVGWATGGHWAAWYSSEHPHRVENLVVCNSLYGAIDGHPMLGRGSAYEEPARPGHFHDARHGAYRFSTGPSLLSSWDSGIPVDDKAQWRDPQVAAAYVDHALASDPTSGDRLRALAGDGRAGGPTRDARIAPVGPRAHADDGLFSAGRWCRVYRSRQWPCAPGRRVPRASSGSGVRGSAAGAHERSREGVSRQTPPWMSCACTTLRTAPLCVFAVATRPSTPSSRAAPAQVEPGASRKSVDRRSAA